MTDSSDSGSDDGWLSRAAHGAWDAATSDAGPAEMVDMRGQPSDLDRLRAAWPQIQQTVAHPINALGALAQWAKANPEAIGSLVGGMVNPTGGPAQAGAPMVRAYHGSGVLFKPTPRNPLGEFDNRYIGTGANAQMFSHGHYAAQAKPIGVGFRNMLAIPEVKLGDEAISFADTPVERLQRDPKMMAWHVLRQEINNPQDAFAGAMKRLTSGWYRNVEDPVEQGALDLLRKWKEQGATVGRGGGLYHVDIPHDVVDQMLDWDKPLSKQPLHVQGGVKHVFNNLETTFKDPESVFNGWVEGANEKSVYGDINDFHHLPGSAIYQMLKRGYRQKGTTEQLLKSGVRGMKVLDDYSRPFLFNKSTPTNELTRNFVIYDPKDAKIVDREAHGGLVKGNGAIMQALRGYAEGGAVDSDGSWLGRAAQGAWQGATADAGPMEQIDLRGQPSLLERAQAAWPDIKQTVQHPIGALAALVNWAKENPDKVGALVGGMVNPTGGPTQASSPLGKVLANPERDAAFHALADAQRGHPENAMLAAQRALGGADRPYYESANAWTHAMEHVGDLTHRMSEKYRGSKFGKELVQGKVRTGLNFATNPVDAKRILAIPRDVFPELDTYANAHAALPVYNEAQLAAREAAVYLGRGHLSLAARHLRKLQQMIDDGTYEKIAGSYDPHFEMLKDPADPTKPLKLYRGVVGGPEGIPEGALRGEPRERYNTFMSTSPYVANTYGTPDLRHGMTGAITPLHVSAHKVTEYPSRIHTFSDGTQHKYFDKFGFDDEAQRLGPGEALVVRDAVDMGPRHSPDPEHQRLASFPSDIYAIGKGTKTKPGFKKGGGAIMRALKSAK